jgi:hypothetical protein
MKWLACLSAATVTLAGAQAPKERSVPASELPPARDGNIAIEQELCAARKAGSLEAYDLFIARHPKHPLARVAQQEREQLLRERPDPRR